MLVYELDDRLLFDWKELLLKIWFNSEMSLKTTRTVETTLAEPNGRHATIDADIQVTTEQEDKNKRFDIPESQKYSKDNVKFSIIWKNYVFQTSARRCCTSWSISWI